MSRASLNGGLERPLCEAVKLKPGLPWRTQDIRDARVMGYLRGELLTQNSTSPRRKKCVIVNKADQSWRSENILTSDMEMQNVEIAQWVFSLSLTQYFLTVIPSLRFGKVMYISCHCMLQVCDLFLILISQGIIVKRLHESHKKL